MKIMKLLSVSLTLLTLSLWGQISPQGVRVTGTINDSTGSAFTGNLHFTWPQHTDANGYGVVGGTTRIPIVAGVIDVRLLSSLNGGTIGSYKYDVFGVNTLQTGTYSSSWVIPKTTAVLDVAVVATASSGGGATLPSTSNILAGNGSGGAVSLPTPTLCSTGQAPTGITSTGAATGCAAITAATYSTQLLDLKVGWNNAHLLTVGTCASGATCSVFYGSSIYTATGGCTITNDSSGSSNGTVFIYFDTADSLIHRGYTSGTPGVGGTCTDAGAITGPPTGSVLLAMWSIVGGAFPAEVLTGSGKNDTRPWLRVDSGSGVPQMYRTMFGYVAQTGGVFESGNFWRSTTTPSPTSAGRNGAVIAMSNTSGSEVEIYSSILPSWDGNAINVIAEWYQTNGAPGGTSVRWDVSAQCTHAGSSVTPGLGTVGSTTVLVPASSQFAYSSLPVPLSGCAKNDDIAISVKNSPTGTGTTYVGGDFFLRSLTIRIVQ